MAFTPSTVVYLLNVPLSVVNKNQINFSGTGAQTSYFQSRIVTSFTDFTYQRKDNIIRVPVNVENIWNVNYVMYQNSNFGNKWFYAFVTKLEYINPNCTHLHIKTDVFQTWQFDFTFGECFVNREHTLSDSIGGYIEDEPLNPNCFPHESKMLIDVNKINIGIAVFFNKRPSLITTQIAQTNSGAPSAEFVAFYDNMDDLNTAIIGLESVGQMEYISDVGLCYNNSLTYTEFLPTSENFIYTPFEPKNKKCYNYCYGMIMGNNNYKLTTQQLKDTNFTYTASGCFGSNSFVYVNLNDIPNTTISYSDGFPLPKIPLNTSANQLATATFKNISNLVGSIGNNVLTGKATPVTIGTSLGTNLLTQAINEVQIDMLPNQLSGFTPSTAQYNEGYAGVALIKYSPDYNTFKHIDEYFTAYGYQVNTVKIPQYTSRPNHNYLKTTNCIIKGNIPQDDLTELENIFNNGVTIWHNPATYGDYTPDNSV